MKNCLAVLLCLFLASCGGGGGGGGTSSSSDGFRLFLGALDLAPQTLSDPNSDKFVSARFSRMSESAFKTDSAAVLRTIGGDYTVNGEEEFPFTLALYGDAANGYGLLPLAAEDFDGDIPRLRVVNFLNGASTLVVRGLAEAFTVPFARVSTYNLATLGANVLNLEFADSTRSVTFELSEPKNYVLFVSGEVGLFLSTQLAAE